MNAVGNSDMLMKMNEIREMQEKLTLKHFEIDQMRITQERYVIITRSVQRSVLLNTSRWNIVSAKLISPCPNLECTSTVLAVRYTHAQLTVANGRPYRRSAFLIRTLSEFELG